MIEKDADKPPFGVQMITALPSAVLCKLERRAAQPPPGIPPMLSPRRQSPFLQVAGQSFEAFRLGGGWTETPYYSS